MSGVSVEAVAAGEVPAAGGGTTAAAGGAAAPDTGAVTAGAGAGTEGGGVPQAASISAIAQAAGTAPAGAGKVRLRPDPGVHRAGATGQNARMALLILEALLALAVLLFIVWWTMFSGRRRGEPRDGHEDRDSRPGGRPKE